MKRIPQRKLLQRKWKKNEKGLDARANGFEDAIDGDKPVTVVGGGGLRQNSFSQDPIRIEIRSKRENVEVGGGSYILIRTSRLVVLG
ncbi:hypothetical protein EYC84_006914 [Monilinia fructicola]|uniref:Uncharacterized protein n=1 Tax=Monilinia fructicola TaxID=38448 RepID=A0A5M9K9U4_MONFR|nr:hypothetical protein EYC84_006914 [Monilinia fructicola]